ncbi:MAG: Lrp/AsnC family transcriptional regulator [Caulobacteraceae bacterium]
MRVGLSASSVFERVRRLERSGAILGYRAIIDASALGARFDAWIEATLPVGSRSVVAGFIDLLIAAPEVISAHQMARSEDFLLHVQTRSAADWRDFLARTERTGIDLSVVRTALVTDCIKAPVAYQPNARQQRAF